MNKKLSICSLTLFVPQALYANHACHILPYNLFIF